MRRWKYKIAPMMKAIAATVNNSLITTVNKSLVKVLIFQVKWPQSRDRISSAHYRASTGDPLVPQAKNYEYFYNTAHMNLLEIARLPMAEGGKTTCSRLIICGQCIVSHSEQIKSVLQHLEHGKVNSFNLEEGIAEYGESVRGKVELGDRVYVR